MHVHADRARRTPPRVDSTRRRHQGLRCLASAWWISRRHNEWDLLAGSGLIVDEAVRAAEETARSLLPLVERQVEPFGHAALPWLHSLDRSPQEGPKPGDLGLPAVAAGG